ncbi:MAG: histidine kinase dimerization/phospho-acceptor domain-containing protein [candidate division WOR-3 bacterium]
MKQILVFQLDNQEILKSEKLNKQSITFEEDLKNLEGIKNEIKIDLILTSSKNLDLENGTGLLKKLFNWKIPVLVVLKKDESIDKYKDLFEVPFIDFIYENNFENDFEFKMEKIIGVKNYIISCESMSSLQHEIGKISKLSVAGELISSISHMINNPVTSIVLQLDMLRMDKNCPKELHKKIDMIEQNVDRIVSIVSTVRELKLGVSEKMELVNVEDETVKFFPIIKDYFINHNVEIEYTYDKKIPPVKLPCGFLKYIFLELILLLFHRCEKVKGNKIIVNFRLLEDSIYIIFNTNFKTGIEMLFENVEDENSRSDVLTINSIKFDIENVSGKLIFKDYDSGSEIKVILPLPAI